MGREGQVVIGDPGIDAALLGEEIGTEATSHMSRAELEAVRKELARLRKLFGACQMDMAASRGVNHAIVFGLPDDEEQRTEKRRSDEERAHLERVCKRIERRAQTVASLLEGVEVRFSGSLVRYETRLEGGIRGLIGSARMVTRKREIPVTRRRLVIGTVRVEIDRRFVPFLAVTATVMYLGKVACFDPTDEAITMVPMDDRPYGGGIGVLEASGAADELDPSPEGFLFFTRDLVASGKVRAVSVPQMSARGVFSVVVDGGGEDLQIPETWGGVQVEVLQA